MNRTKEGEQTFWELTGIPEFKGLEPTNWWVITGEPGSGKSTLLEYLSKHGLKTMPEAARNYIDREMDKGRSIEAIRADEREFQQQVAYLKRDYYGSNPTNKVILWDRGSHDAEAYVSTAVVIGLEDIVGLDTRYNQGNVVYGSSRRFKGVFLLDGVPEYTGDYARIEDEERAKKLHAKLDEIYRFWGYEPVRVPLLSSNSLVSVQKRAQFVVDCMRSIDPNIPVFEIPLSEQVQPELPLCFNGGPAKNKK